MKTFAIDFVRQAIRQTLLLQNNANPDTYIGNEEQLSLVSFYEHLASDEEVDRFVDAVRDLTNQENRTQLIANGIIIAPSNPTITNLNQCTIIPMDFTTSFRCTLENRDLLLETLNNMVSILKGRKVDIAEFDNGKLMMVGTVANNVNGKPILRNGDFIGTLSDATINLSVRNKLMTYHYVYGTYFETEYAGSCYFYYQSAETGQLKVAYGTGNTQYPFGFTFTEIEDDHENHQDIIFPPEHNSFTKYCLSISFDSQRCSEPRTLNAQDYCEVSFGGSATLVSSNVMLGNELTKLGIKKFKLIKSDDGSGDTTYNEDFTWLEPLEMPSSNSADTQINQLISNNFVNNSHTNNITVSNQYTFVMNKDIFLLMNWFNYARYGTSLSNIRPNIIYRIVELYCSWGNINDNYYNAKIVESIDVENTESDTITITIPFQIQGDNN